MDNDYIYNNSKEILMRRESNVYTKFIVLCIVMSMLLIYIVNIEYTKQHHLEGTVENNKIVLYLPKESLEYLKGNTLQIRNMKLRYKVESITKLDYDMNYYLVKLEINKKLINNDVVHIVLNDGLTTLYKDFIKRIWKGFD